MNKKQASKEHGILAESFFVGFANAGRFLGIIVLCLVTLLTGCVRYDVAVNFDSQQGGTLVQHIKLGEQLTSLNQSEAKKWLNSIEERSRQLQGKVKRISPQEVLVTIPFGNGQELVSKFNQFFHAKAQDDTQLANQDSLDLIQLDAKMSLQQSNFLLFERDRLSLTVDLTGLGVLSEGGKIIVSPGSLLDLKFQLNSPWTVRTKSAENIVDTEVNSEKNRLTWQLQPGQVNYIETVFWLPSPLGIGSVIIILLIVGGFYLKYKHLPGFGQTTVSSKS